MGQLVYLIGYEDKSMHTDSDNLFPVKVGSCRGQTDPYVAVRIRLQTLQIGNSYPLKIYGYTVVCGLATSLESDIHKILKKEGRHIRGEWYLFTNEELKEVLEETEHVLENG